MSMAERGWRDSTENYCDGYKLTVNGSTATAVNGQDYKQPTAVFGLSITINTSVGSGLVTLVDGSATADAGDSRKWQVDLASGNGGPYTYQVAFARGLVFDTGLIISASTITGSVSLLYKPRY